MEEDEDAYQVALKDASMERHETDLKGFHPTTKKETRTCTEKAMPICGSVFLTWELGKAIEYIFASGRVSRAATLAEIGG